jgi:predicted RNA methylase
MQIDSMYNDFEGKVVLDLGTGTVRPCSHAAAIETSSN